MQWVADADLTLDLRVRQVGHDGTTLDIGATGGHIPRRHAYPQLDQEGRGEGETKAEERWEVWERDRERWRQRDGERQVGEKQEDTESS